jgi:hypothetical protein
MGRVLGTGLRGAAAAVLYLVCFVVPYGALLPPQAAPPAGEEPLSAGAALLLVAVLNTAALGWPILRAGRRGWALAVPLAVAFFGIQTFMAQVESVIFQAYPAYARHLPLAMVPRIMLAGLVHAALWVPLAVVVFGRFRSHGAPVAPGTVAVAGWPWRLALAAAVYVVLYFTFGYFVAWRVPEVHRYYGGTDPGSLWLALRDVFVGTPWLPPAQLVRGLLWTGLGLLVIRILGRTRLESSLAVATLFAVVLSSGLLLPNPYMPFAVRMAHLAETASSDFLFGLVVGWLLAPRR